MCVIIQMKATEQYVPVVLFIMLYEVVLAFESVDSILKCDHLNESLDPRHNFCSYLTGLVILFLSKDSVETKSS